MAINLTAITTRSGYWQLYSQGGAVPFTSNLNSPSGNNAIMANQAIVPVDASGGITIFSEGGGDLLIDLVGTFTRMFARHRQVVRTARHLLRVDTRR